MLVDELKMLSSGTLVIGGGTVVEIETLLKTTDIEKA